MVVSAPEKVSTWLFCVPFYPLLWLHYSMVQQCRTLSHDGTSCRWCCWWCWCCGLSIAPWTWSCVVCKACWVEWLHNRHGWWDVTTTRSLAISAASVTACRVWLFFFYFILLFLFPCTFSIPIITSSMIMMSGRFWFMVVFMTGRDFKSLSFFLLWTEKCLLVSHGWKRTVSCETI